MELAAPTPALVDGAVALASGHHVTLADFEPLRAFLLELLDDSSRPLSQRLLAISVAVDLVDMYVPTAVSAERAECPDAAAALALYLEEMRATESERLWSIAERAGAKSPSAGTMFVAAAIDGRYRGKPAKRLFLGACGLLWFFAKASTGYAFAYFKAVDASHAPRRVLATLADLDASPRAEPFAAFFRDRLSRDEWLTTESTLRFCYRRALALYPIYGWHVAAFAFNDVDGPDAAKRSIEVVASDFAPANSLDRVAARWPVFPQTMANWLSHRAYAPTMISLATRSSKME